jgi:hypothetical protein
MLGDVPVDAGEPVREGDDEAGSSVKLARYPKKKRGPKKSQPRKKSGSRNHHISTARLLLKRRKKTP